jgi:Spy/CpxP family protein refolding chaperone
MNQLKTYKILVIILVIINLGSLAVLWSFWFRERPERDKSGRPEEIFKALNLDKEQRDLLRAQRQEHIYRLRQLQAHDKKLHEEFFSGIFNEKPDSTTIERMLDSILNLRREMEMLTFNHFRDMHEALDPEQRQIFRKNFRKTLDRVMPPQRPAHRLPDPPPPPPADN